jgi:putative transcriptional regulator
MDGKVDPSTYNVRIYDDSDVCAIRLKLGLSQAKFAARYGFSLDTVRKWEQKTRKPSGAALTLLRVIARHPEIVAEVLAA